MDVRQPLANFAQKETAYLQGDKKALPLLANGQLRVHDPNPFLPRDLGLKAPVQPRPGG